MANVRDIRKRIKAVGNIRRITKTMQMIAASRFAKSQLRATATKPFTEGIYELVTELASKAGNITHPLISGPAGAPGGAKGPELLLVITSDRGLCGPYNGNILRTAISFVRQSPTLSDPAKREVEIVGKKGQAFLKFNKVNINKAHTLGDKPTFESVEALAQNYMDRFTRGEISGVRVVFMRYISASRQRAEVLQLLPLKPPAKDAAAPKAAAEPGEAKARAKTVQYDFTPEPEVLLADLLPVTVKASLFQCLMDAIVSEHVARMVAMKSATDNAGKMGKFLSRKYNRVRQAQITTELTEIVSGAAALE